MEGLSPPQAAILNNQVCSYICDKEYVGYMFQSPDDADTFAAELGKGDQPIAFEADKQLHTVKVRKELVDQIFRDIGQVEKERASPICHPLVGQVTTLVSNTFGRLVAAVDAVPTGPVDALVNVMTATATRAAEFGASLIEKKTPDGKKED